mmetsp:Transcript_14802/g.14598  ORF Transcript_14802/g.14598 Transcript_14802/m.14598 type:complete len:92 (+) Transcript_14802:114-389(+)
MHLLTSFTSFSVARYIHTGGGVSISTRHDRRGKGGVAPIVVFALLTDEPTEDADPRVLDSPLQFLCPDAQSSPSQLWYWYCQKVQYPSYSS